MILQPTFQAIETYSHLVEKNEFFSQYTNSQIPGHYDANFVLLHFNPTLPEFKMVEKMHREYQESINQKHLHFYWPEDTGLFVDLLDYLNKEHYETGMEELFHIKPEDFMATQLNPNVQIEQVTKNTFKSFLALNYQEDIKNGKEYAEHMDGVYHHQFEWPQVQFFIAKIDQTPVGSFQLISSENYLEMDNVLTDSNYRHQGIATMLMAYVMEKATRQNKSVVLIADAEDTPKEMYKKVGFQMIASQIHARKMLN